jgi:tetratricopeptide (TPR) repeat protein
MGDGESRLEELRELVRARRYVLAVRSAKALLDEDELDPRERAEAHHICAVALFKQEQVFPALTHEERAHHLAVELQLHDLVQRVRVNLVAILVDVGEYQRAIELGDTILTDESLPVALRSQLAYVHYNVAQAYRARRDKRPMFDHLRKAVRLGEECHAPVLFRVQMAQQLAWHLYMDEQIAEADRYVEAVAALLDSEDTEGNNEQLLLACLRAYQVGDLAKAVVLAEELTPHNTTATSRQIAWAYLISGWVASEVGQLDEAANFADTVLNRALSLNSPELMNKANSLRHKIMSRREAAD